MKFNPLLIKFLSLWFLKVSLLLGLISILYLLIKSLKKKKRELYKYKISNFYLNWIYILTYVSIFLGLFIYFRVLRTNYFFDLKSLSTFLYKVITLYNLDAINTIYLSFVFLLFILIMLLSIIKVHIFFINEILKRNLYWYIGSFNYTKKHPGMKWYKNYYLFRNRFCDDYSARGISLKFRSVIIIDFGSMLYFYVSKLNIKEQVFQQTLITICNIIEYLIPVVIHITLIILLFYDCIYNNWIISKIFYYLPFYIIYSLWRRISNFCRFSDLSFDILYYDLYYNQDLVEYSNFSDEEEELIYSYQDNGLQFLSTQDTSELFDYYFFKLCLHNKYMSKDGKIFLNGQNEGYIREVDPSSEDGYRRDKPYDPKTKETDE